jgi:tyrosine-protein kinase Etk/Wzc
LPAVKNIPQSGLEYLRKLRDVKYNETVFELLAKQFEIAKIDEAKEGQAIQVVDPAIEPDKKSKPKRSLIVVIGTLAGLMMSIVGVLANAALRKSK